jgi:hypothetical protein
MPHVIFNGPPGSGKDEACHFLETIYGYKHLRMKDQLFIDTARHFGVSLEWFMTDYDVQSEKERPLPELFGLSKREAMIHVSEKVMKPRHGNDYYGRITAEKIDMVSSYCFSDGGFVDEVLPVINTLGHENVCIAQIYRTGCSFSSDSRNYLHGILQEDLGKQEMVFQEVEPKLSIRMYRLHNNTSISDFHSMIRTVLRKEANADPKTLHFSGKSL